MGTLLLDLAIGTDERKYSQSACRVGTRTQALEPVTWLSLFLFMGKAEIR